MSMWNRRPSLPLKHRDYHASEKKPPTTLTTTIKNTPRRARESLTRTAVVPPDLPLLLLPLPLPLVEVDPGLFTVAGVLGVLTPVADARQELATAVADAVEAVFTVPLPPKLHAWALRFCDS
jgi:hypothetical protein